eukprot:14217-Heterococcus_DN1.PRE.7
MLTCSSCRAGLLLATDAALLLASQQRLPLYCCYCYRRYCCEPVGNECIRCTDPVVAVVAANVSTTVIAAVVIGASHSVTAAFCAAAVARPTCIMTLYQMRRGNGSPYRANVGSLQPQHTQSCVSAPTLCHCSTDTEFHKR